MVVWLSLLVCIVGALVYVISTRAKFSELGRLAFFAGLLVFLLQLPAHTVDLLRPFH